MDDETAAAIAKALAHPARLHIIRLLARQSECRGAEVFSELPLAQSTVSQHLAVLRDAGIVVSHARGPASVYCLAPHVLSDFADEVASLAATATSCSTTTGECA